MVSVIDHLLCHTAVDAYIFAADKACNIRTKIHHHIGDIEGISNSAHGLLHGISTLIDRVIVVYPAGRDRIDSHFSRKLIARACVNAEMPPFAAV